MVSQFATRYCIEQYSGTFHITTYGSAEEALERCKELIDEQEELPDIIFLDLVMGGMDGWGFIEAMEQMNLSQKQPEIYVLSAFVNSKDRNIAKNHTLISGYFDKPLTKNSVERVFAKNLQ